MLTNKSANSEYKQAEQPASDKGPYRLNLTLDPEAKAELDLLKATARKPTLVDVIRAALAVYKLVVEHQQAGGRVVFRHSNNSEEIFWFV